MSEVASIVHWSVDKRRTREPSRQLDKALDEESAMQSAEAFLAALEAKGGDESYLDVDEYITLSKGAAALLRQLRTERQPRGPLTMGLLALWAIWEVRGLPRSVRMRQEVASTPLKVRRLHRPSPEELFPYVLANQPVVIEGVFEDEESFPPLLDFNDFDYLRARCGERLVRVKADAVLDHEGRPVYVSDPLATICLTEFLDHLEEAEAYGEAPACYMGKTRVNEELPELVEDVEKSPSSPLRVYGGCFGANLQGMHTYFGAGNNTTSIHADPGENLLIVISGHKRFDLYPPTDADCLYTVKTLCSSVPPFTNPSAMPKALRDRCPLYRHARPMRVDLAQGDMLYLPMFWWHGVTGSAERNMILNWWCEPHPEKAEPTRPTEGASVILAEIRNRLE